MLQVFSVVAARTSDQFPGATARPLCPERHGAGAGQGRALATTVQAGHTGCPGSSWGGRWHFLQVSKIFYSYTASCQLKMLKVRILLSVSPRCSKRWPWLLDHQGAHHQDLHPRLHQPSQDKREQQVPEPVSDLLLWRPQRVNAALLPWLHCGGCTGASPTVHRQLEDSNHRQVLWP